MDIRQFRNLPGNARAYVEYVAAKAGVPVRHISVGPGCSQVIRMD